MDESALDSLIDTLGGPEENVPTTPVYTGPEITVLCTSHSYFLEDSQLHFNVGFVNIEITQFGEFVEECITFWVWIGESCKKD